MADRPIIFSAPMVRALLDGRKTQTRLALRPQPDTTKISPPFHPEPRAGRSWVFMARDDFPGYSYATADFRAPYAVGDRLFPAMDIPTLNRNYCADLFGEIWSRAGDGETWRRLKGARTSRGYLSVTPAHEGRYKTRLVHRLVAEAFYGLAPSGLPQVRHLNGNELDNAPENLDWGTQEDNWSDRIAHGGSTGEDHPAAKLTRQQVDEIRGSFESQRILANKYGVAQSTIWAAKTGRLWAEAPQPNPPNMPRWASRLTLTVTDLRVQRLQEISYRDAVAEGCYPVHMAPGGSTGDPSDGWLDYREGFLSLWNSLHGAGAWDSNPWVVALTFTVERRNIDARAE